MPTFGQINEFHPENESFSVYLERFELFVLANSIADSKKVPLFLTVLGGNTYGLLHNLMAPDNSKDKSFETITGVLKAHFEPKPLIIAQRFHFHRRDKAQNRSSKRAGWVDSDPQQPQETGEEVLFHVGQKSSHPYQVTLELEGRAITMEIDTGASVSLISEELQKTVFPDAHLTNPTSTLRTYTSEPIPVVGQMTVKVKYGDYVGDHKLYVVKGKGASLLGRDWLKHIRLDWANIKMLSIEGSLPALKELSDRYAEVFQDSLGTMKSFRAHLSLKEGATPRFHRPHSVPFAIKDSVGRERDGLEEAGVLHKIDHSEIEFGELLSTSKVCH